MKKLILISIFLLASSIYSFAQKTPAKAVFFTENGERFWLIMSGQKINNEPAFRVVAENLTEPGYKAKIIFQDEKLGSLDKNIQTQDYEGTVSDVTYTIKKNRKGNYTLNVVSFQPAGSITEKNTETTTTTTPVTEPIKQTTTTNTQVTEKTEEDINIHQQTNVDGVDINMKVGISETGVNIGVTGRENIDMNTKVTTTTSTTGNPSNVNNSKPVETKSTPAPVEQKNTCTTPMSNAEFLKAKESIANQSFTETQLKVAKSITKNNCLNVKQVIELVKIFGYDDTRLDFAKYAYDRTVDKGNYFQVTDAFSFSGTKESLIDFIDAQ